MQGYKLNQEGSKELAEDHVDWFLKAIRPLLIDNFNHGFKHGVEAAIEAAMRPNTETRFCMDREVCRGK